MSTSSSLSSLPVELIHHLLEYLDIGTILFSFRYVCKRFHTIVNTFDQYKIDMRLIAKTDFDRICSTLCPNKICSIILTNDMHTPHQIPIFLSRFSFDQFVRLQSLYLIKIEENNLFSVLMHLSKCSLQSLTIDCAAWDMFSYTIRVLLASTIAESTLEKLDLNIAYRDLDMISWPPLPVTLKSLRLERCTFQEYCMILRHNIHLRKFQLTECLMYQCDDTIYQPTDLIAPRELTSLSFGACFMRMKELLIFLSCTPNLQELELIIWTDSSDSIINGNKWENFLSEKLPSLKQFRFFFDDLTQINHETVNIENYLQAFRTPFWLEDKRWYVTCDYVKTLSVIRLYTLPIRHASFNYYTNSKKISDSTWITTENSKQLQHRVQELNLNLNELYEPDQQIHAKIDGSMFGGFSSLFENHSTRNPIFCGVKRLSLNLDGRSAYTSLPHLRTIVDFFSVTRLSMQILNHSITPNSFFMDYITLILKETSNIHSLKIIIIHIEEMSVTTETMCSIIPRSVQHLQISITNLEQMKKILEQLSQLLSVTFYSPNISNYYKDIKKWIQSARKDSSCREGLRSIQIWLGPLINHEQDKSSKRRVLQRLRHRYSN